MPQGNPAGLLTLATLQELQANATGAGVSPLSDGNRVGGYSIPQMLGFPSKTDPLVFDVSVKDERGNKGVWVWVSENLMKRWTAVSPDGFADRSYKTGTWVSTYGYDAERKADSLLYLIVEHRTWDNSPLPAAEPDEKYPRFGFKQVAVSDPFVETAKNAPAHVQCALIAKLEYTVARGTYVYPCVVELLTDFPSFCEDDIASVLFDSENEESFFDSSIDKTAYMFKIDVIQHIEVDTQNKKLNARYRTLTIPSVYFCEVSELLTKEIMPIELCAE